MLANRMGGFLRQRPQLMERIRNLKNMRGMGRKFMMPGMGLASLPMLGDRDVNDLPIPQAGASLDIMPRFRSLPKQPPQVGTAPLMTGGNAALLPPDIAPLPPKPMMGANMGMPNFMSAGQPPKMVMGMKKGGEAKQYPNEGLAALAKVAPEVVERMGYVEGGPVAGLDMPSGSDADMMNYQNTLRAIRELKSSLSPRQQQYFDSAVQEILGESGRTISNQDREILKKRGFNGGMSDMQKRKLARLRSLAGGAGLGPGALKVPPSLRVD